MTVRIDACDLSSPSPLAQEIITARPYAFLDDAPAEERRTQAIRSRHLMDADEAARLARPDPAAIDSGLRRGLAAGRATRMSCTTPWC